MLVFFSAQRTALTLREPLEEARLMKYVILVAGQLDHLSLRIEILHANRAHPRYVQLLPLELLLQATKFVL